MKMYAYLAAAIAVGLSLLLGAAPAVAADLGALETPDLSDLSLLGMAVAGTLAGKSAAELASEFKSDFGRKFDELKANATDMLGRLEKGEKFSEDVKLKADEAISAAGEAKARLDEMEQKMAQRGQDGPSGLKTAGERFIADDNVKAFMANPSSGKRVGVELDSKAIISGLSTDADGSAGDLVVPQRGPLVPGVERRLTIRDLLMPGQTSSGSIQYPKETGFTNSADTHTETAGTVKPQSEIKFDIVTASVTTIAHWVIATRQILDDAPMLQSYIDGRLRYGLKLVEEDQLLNGGGTGTDLNGIYTQASASTANLMTVEAPSFIDVIRVAILQAALAEFPPNGVVLNPMDWAKIELTKDGNENYVIGNPQDSAQPRLWGLPVVSTQAMTVNKFLVGAFGMGAQIFDRQDASVEISTEDSDNFRKNLVTILAEERLALAVYRPEAFVKGDFSAQVTDLTS